MCCIGTYVRTLPGRTYGCNGSRRKSSWLHTKSPALLGTAAGTPAPAMAGAVLAAVSGARSGSQFPAREATASFWDAAHAHPACAP